MDDQNPYASPRYDGRQIPPEAEEIVVEVARMTPCRWRDYLLVPHGATLAERCVKCGAESNLIERRQKVFWCSPWVLLALLCHLFVLIALVLFLGRRGVLYIALCEKHAKRRRRAVVSAWTLCFLGVALIVTGGAMSSGASRNDLPAVLFFCAVLLFIIGTLCGIWGARTLHVKYIDKQAIWLKKLPRVFYEHLPELRSADGRNPIIPWSR